MDMKQKYCSFLAIFALIGMILIVGCAQQEEPKPILVKEPSVDKVEEPSIDRLDIAREPSVDVEATVVSLYLDDLHGDCQQPEVCPRDRATLRIDKIDRTDDPNNVINLNVGDEVEFHLTYSARPTKLRKDILPACPAGWILESGSCVREGCEGPACPVSSPSYAEKPAGMEDNYIIYHLPQRADEVTESILPGLEENSKIRIMIWQHTLIQKEIGEYKLIS
jgi:hypothetical protein